MSHVLSGANFPRLTHVKDPVQSNPYIPCRIDLDQGLDSITIYETLPRENNTQDHHRNASLRRRIW